MAKEETKKAAATVEDTRDDCIYYMSIIDDSCKMKANEENCKEIKQFDSNGDCTKLEVCPCAWLAQKNVCKNDDKWETTCEDKCGEKTTLATCK